MPHDAGTCLIVGIEQDSSRNGLHATGPKVKLCHRTKTKFELGGVIAQNHRPTRTLMEQAGANQLSVPVQYVPEYWEFRFMINNTLVIDRCPIISPY